MGLRWLIEESTIHLGTVVPVIEGLFGMGHRKRGKAPRVLEIAGPDRNRTQIECYRPADRLSMIDGKASGKALFSDRLCIIDCSRHPQNPRANGQSRGAIFNSVAIELGIRV